MTKNRPPLPIGRRIRDLLAELGQSQRWLAQKAGLESSTIARIVSGDRNPTAQTLQDIAPVLGVTLGELVAGTDAEGRVKDAEQLISRAHYERAVADVLAYEARANQAESKLLQCRQVLDDTTQRFGTYRKQADDRAEVDRRRVEQLERDRDDARRLAAHHEDDARRYRDGLERAVMDVAALQDSLRRLEREMGSAKKSSQVASIFAGVAAVASVATYLTTSPGTSERRRRAEDEDA